MVDAALRRGAWFAGTDLAQPRTEQLQPADDVADEVRESVHRNRNAQQRVRPVLVDPSLPGTKSCGCDVEAIGRLAGRPATSRPEFHDAHPLQRSVMRSPMRRHSVHASILDPEFLGQQCDLLFQPVDLRPEPGVLVQRYWTL